MEQLNSNSIIGKKTMVKDEKENTESVVAEKGRGLITRILGKSIDEAQKKYENALLLYQDESSSVSNDLVKLYIARKDSVELIQKACDFLVQCNCDATTINSMGFALSYTAVFRKVMELDIKGELPSVVKEGENIEHYAASILTGLRTQDSRFSMAASLGSALAISTSLSSTLAYGSAAAASLLAGPIGWVTGGIMLFSVGLLKWRNNNNAIKKLEDCTNEIQKKLALIKREHGKLKKLIDTTIKMNDDLRDSFHRFDNEFSNKEIWRIVDLCKALGKIMNETIEMQNSHE